MAKCSKGSLNKFNTYFLQSLDSSLYFRMNFLWSAQALDQTVVLSPSTFEMSGRLTRFSCSLAFNLIGKTSEIDQICLRHRSMSRSSGCSISPIFLRPPPTYLFIPLLKTLIGIPLSLQCVFTGYALVDD